jgi:hypothetical protein
VLQQLGLSVEPGLEQRLVGERLVQRRLFEQRLFEREHLGLVVRVLLGLVVRVVVRVLVGLVFRVVVRILLRVLLGERRRGGRGTVSRGSLRHQGR